MLPVISSSSISARAKTDRQGRFVCQHCGGNVARVLTFRRCTEIDYLVDYAEGLASVKRLADSGDTLCESEYLCFDCHFEQLAPGEIDEPADFGSDQSSEPAAWDAGNDDDAEDAQWEDQREPALLEAGRMPARELVWGG